MPPRPDVRLESDEADAALSILRKRIGKQQPTAADWERVFSSTGYVRLKERETSMGRSFTDSAFTAFLMSDTLLRRTQLLDQTVQRLRRLDVDGAAARALKYLPAGTVLKASLYLEIKPRTNSFVFTGPSIFLYVDPRQTPAQLENTITHELHHIGLQSACPDPSPARAVPAQAMLLRILGALSEGQAMLAAAGSPWIHPHAADADSVRARWDRDVARAPQDIAELSHFFTSVLDGSVTSPDSVQARAFTYFGVQGPWYTVGWLMASTIERVRGRATLVHSMCDPTEFIALYNEAAKNADPSGRVLPRWDAGLVQRLISLRIALSRSPA
ncbi:MAG: DUF5700 domain-containing putative Zn-dependent protease [Gemmatimonadaceae bacterium]